MINKEKAFVKIRACFNDAQNVDPERFSFPVYKERLSLD